MEELSLPDMIAAHRLMQLSGREAQGEDLSNYLSLKNIIKLVCDDTLEDENKANLSSKRKLEDENKANLSSKRKVEEIECEIPPSSNATKRMRYRSLDSIYKETRPIGDARNAGTSFIIGVK